ncbi:MAG: CrcB family protein [Woeseiaceae bacterium]
MAAVFWVAMGGALGAAARHLVNVGLHRFGGMLASTLLVNTLGCLLMGWLFYRFSVRDIEWWSGQGRSMLATGFCGAFTTMSALALEVHSMHAQGQTFFASGYALLNLALSLVALTIGVGLARQFS